MAYLELCIYQLGQSKTLFGSGNPSHFRVCHIIIMLTNKSNPRDVNVKCKYIIHLKQKNDIQVLQINIVHKNTDTDI